MCIVVYMQEAPWVLSIINKSNKLLLIKHEPQIKYGYLIFKILFSPLFPGKFTE